MKSNCRNRSLEMERRVNWSSTLSLIHACYEIDDSYVLMRNLSVMCVLFHIFLGALSVVTVCGNLLVIISIIYFKQLHTPTNTLILSLAVADLLVGVIVFPLTIEFSMGVCMFDNNLLCQVRGVFDVSLCTSSILNLCCISVDRYYAVCQPLTYKTKVNDHVVVVMVMVSWGLSLLIGVAFIIVGISQKNCTSTCLIDFIIANIFGLIFSFYLPVIVMLFIYLKIFFVARRQAHSIQSLKSRRTIGRLESKATKTLAIVMGVFLICWLPFFLCQTVMSFSRVYIPIAVFEILNWFALSNSMLNPFIYAFFYSWFRSAFRMIISGKILNGDLSNSKLL
ncbi:trace amine-associated receptor 1-like [Antennarius striatus]|uniref:trace amine-associated receptor 1-like n=1 Tax=Antennarius striatus TaxID=241820 RepID=UPI0035B17741